MTRLRDRPRFGPARPLRAILTLGATLVVAWTVTLEPAAAQEGTQGSTSRLERIELTRDPPSGAVTLFARVGSHGALRHLILERPWRIVVDVDGVRHALDNRDLAELRSGSLEGIRTSQFRPGTVRIVLDVTERPRYQVRTVEGGVRIDLEGGSGDSAPPSVRPTPAGAGAEVGPDAPGRVGEPERLRPAGALPLAPEGPVVAVVTEIAGSTFYVDAGARQGLFDGDTLAVTKVGDGSPLGSLAVLSSASEQALLAFAGRPFPITLGDSVGLQPLRRGRTARVAQGPGGNESAPGATRLAEAMDGAEAMNGAEAMDGAESAGVAESAGDAQLVQRRLPATVRGQIHLSMNAQSSSTRWGGGVVPLQRSFLTPTTRLRLEARDLPGDVTVTANLRGSYRHESAGLIDPVGSLRVYELSVEKRFDRAPVRIQAGRFFSPYEAFSGYFDGALVRVGSESLGVGGAVGMEPDRWNEGFSTARPKRSAFVDFLALGSGRGVRGEFAAVQVNPVDVGYEQLYFGWSGQAWMGALNVSHTAQIDRDPNSGRWVISDLLVQGGLPVAGPLRLRGSWSRRSPFYFWRKAAPISYRRDDIGGGLRLDLSGATVSADLAAHQIEGDSAWSRSYAGSLRVHSIAGSRFGLNGSASFWDNDLLRMLDVAAGVDRSWGRGFGRVGYRMIDSRNAWFDLVSHQAEGLIDLPIQPGVRATVMGHARFGRGLRGYRLQVGLWRSF